MLYAHSFDGNHLRIIVTYSVVMCQKHDILVHMRIKETAEVDNLVIPQCTGWITT